jgi:tRNA (guanine37-N1)-methyltransferase
MANYDTLGNVVIVKFGRGAKVDYKRKFAREFLGKHKNTRTVLEKIDKFKGRLRTLKTKFIGGEKTKEVLYKENNTIFRFNVDSCYFSPRLANERLEIAKMVKKKEEVLVMFGGVAPFAIVIGKYAKPKRIVSVELGRECSKYALENVKRNKVNVEVVQGDVRRAVPKIKGNFDRIVMARPNLKDSFLDVAFSKIRKNGIIHYYGFYKEDKLDSLRELIHYEALKARRKIKILGIKKAGDIGIRKYRYRVDIKILN